MISVRWGIGLACLFACLLIGKPSQGGVRSATSKQDNRLLVVINRDSIRTEDMNKLIIDMHNKMSNETKSNFDYEKLLKKTVNDRLIIQEALAMQMDKDERLTRVLVTIRENHALAQFLRQNYKPNIQVSKKEVSKTFEHFYAKYQIRSIAVATQADAGKRIEEIKKGVSMDSLAKTFSLDTHKYDGGLHPLLHYADIEIVLRDLAIKMKEGEISKPFKYRDVYAFIRLEKFIPSDPKELPAFEKFIKDMLTEEKKQSSWEKFLTGLKTTNPVKVDSANLARIAKDSTRVLTAEFTKGDSLIVIQTKSGGKISDQAFRSRLSRYVMSDGNVGYGGLVDKTLTNLSAELVLSAAVKSKGYLNLPAVNVAVHHSMDSCLIELYIQEMVAKSIKFNKPEFEAYYQKHLDDFRDPEQFKFSKLVVSSKDSAEALVTRLNRGADFNFLATQLSSGKNPGSRGEEWVTLTVLPERIQAQLKGLEIGRHSGAFNTTEGWVIFNVEDRRKGKVKTMEEVDINIRQAIFQKKFNDGMDTVLATLKKNTSITYYQDNIRNYFGKPN